MPLLSRNVEFGRPLKISSWRKVAIGTWRTAGDPSTYALVEMDVGPALDYIQRVNHHHRTKVTLTHFLGKALAQTFEKYPEINCTLRFGRLYPRKTIDIFFQVANDEAGKDLSGTVIRNMNAKTLAEIAHDMKGKVHSIRKEGDPSFKKMKNTMGFIPGFLIQTIISLTGFLMYALNLWSPLLGSPKDPFGSAMITNIGTLGIDLAFAPLVPYSRVPILIAAGAIRATPVVKNGKIEIAQICKLGVTLDHRLIDGKYASLMRKALTRVFENPDEELGFISPVDSHKSQHETSKSNQLSTDLLPTSL